MLEYKKKYRILIKRNKMAGKRKMTGFARLLLALIIIVPGAYIGASYMSGEDGIQNVKNLIGLGQSKNVEQVRNPSRANTSEQACEVQIKSYKKQVENLRQENERLRAEINDLKK